MAAPQSTSSQQAPRQFNNGYFPNGAVSGPVPGATPLLPNQGRVIQSGPVRVLCVADVRGNLKSLNELAKSARADYIIHTGDFGFYDERSLDRIAEKTLKHVIQYSPLIGEDVRHQVGKIQPGTSIKERFRRDQLPLSELPHFLNNSMSFDVPVYSVWGACEDVQVLEKLRSGEYKIDKLHILDEAHSRLLDIGGVKLRLLGLGGAVVMHKLFDNGEGRTTIAGGQGTMWTTLLQMGELVDTANRVYDPSETRVLVTHASPAREGLLNQLSVTLKADFSVSAGLHFRYGSSYNEFSVNPTLDHYRGKLAASKASFNDVWETVKSEVEPAVQENEAQQKLLNNAIEIVSKMPSVASSGNPFGGQTGSNAGQVDESAFKNMWNFNLADAAFGWLVLEIEGGRIGTEMKAQGFNFAHRGQRNPVLQADMIKPGQPQAATTASPNVMPGSAAATASSSQSQPARPNNAPPVGPPVAQAVQQGIVQTRPMQPARPGSTQAQTAASRPVQPSATTAPANALPAQQSKSPAPAASQGQASLAPVATTQTSKASTTPSPSAATNGAIAAEAKANGTTPSTPAGEEVSKATPPPPERKPSSAIFINGVNSEDETRNLFTDEDKAKIQRVEQRGKAWVVHFSSTEEMQTILKTTQQENAKLTGPNRPVIKEYLENPSYQRNQGGARNWGGNSRGGAQQSGYRSGGASDSEGGRGGRGTYRGSRGRGGDRGGRGGRGRGTFNKAGGEGGAAAGGASSSPTPAAGPGRA